MDCQWRGNADGLEVELTPGVGGRLRWCEHKKEEAMAQFLPRYQTELADLGYEQTAAACLIGCGKVRSLSFHSHCDDTARYDDETS